MQSTKCTLETSTVRRQSKKTRLTLTQIKCKRRKKFEIVQRRQCGSCGRGFTPAPPELRAKTYPLRVILDAITLYNLGHTLAGASSKLKTRSGYRMPPSTRAAWIAEH